MFSTCPVVDHRRDDLIKNVERNTLRGVFENPIEKYFDLPLPKNKILATYIWIDNTGENLRWKDRTLDLIPKIRKDLPILPYDGSATQQASRSNSDMYLVPRAIYRNPFRHGNHILVMCDTFDMNMKPTATNHRVKCAESYMKCREFEPWFGFEQELFFLNCSDSRPLGWPQGGFPKRAARYYCGIGADKMFGRDLVAAHYSCCLSAGVPLWGNNAAIGPSQWKYQVGPSAGVDAGDDLWMSRFILEMLAQEYGVMVTWDPKPVKNWESSSTHTNFSTKKMREENGIEEIEKAIHKLEKVHIKHIKVYDPHDGKDNARRLIGCDETECITSFSAGVAERFCSIGIPRLVSDHKKGYLEDRRPAANCDPYRTTDAIMRTCILNE